MTWTSFQLHYSNQKQSTCIVHEPQSVCQQNLINLLNSLLNRKQLSSNHWHGTCLPTALLHCPGAPQPYANRQPTHFASQCTLIRAARKELVSALVERSSLQTLLHLVPLHWIITNYVKALLLPVVIHWYTNACARWELIHFACCHLSHARPTQISPHVDSTSTKGLYQFDGYCVTASSHAALCHPPTDKLPPYPVAHGPVAKINRLS